MSSRHHIDDFMRGRIIGKIEEGRKITDVAREFDIAHIVVSRLWKSFKTTGMCSRRHGGGRVRSTTPAEDRYIVLSAKRNRRTTAQQVANQFLAASGKQISRKTVARRLRGGGLYARRPVVCVPLTRQHHTARLQWCREHHNWTEQDWACVLFSDENRFSLSSDCRRQLIWRESGTAYRPENIQEKDRYPTCSIMVWAGIMINGRTCLHVVANGTITDQRYIDEVLLPHVHLFRGAVGLSRREGIQRLVWPARSPDLNPIENVWDALGRQVAGRNYPPTNKNTLIRALTEEWDKLPRQLLDNVVQSGEPKSAKRLRSGDLLVETSSSTQTKSFLLIKTFLDSPVNIIPHKSLNTSRGVFSEPDLLTTPEAEILEGFSDQGVIQVRRITIKKDSAVVPTKHLILTFSSPTLPQTIKAEYLNCKIRLYIPNPLRCFKCQRFGHSQTSCHGQLTCSRCASVGHASTDCILEPTARNPIPLIPNSAPSGGLKSKSKK
ncbi:uncharacterized protein TNCV_356871 [Trichonephila clavipes]|nr:uncharacterized protein TNCV_356871 [Trichonephila clavipes]